MSLADIPLELLPRLCRHPLAAAAMRCVCEAYRAAILAELFEFSYDKATASMIFTAISPHYTCSRRVRGDVAGIYFIVRGQREHLEFVRVRDPGWLIYAPGVSVYKFHARYKTTTREPRLIYEIDYLMKIPHGTAPDAAVFAETAIFMLGKTTSIGSLITCMYADACSTAVQCRPASVYKRIGNKKVE